MIWINTNIIIAVSLLLGGCRISPDTQNQGNLKASSPLKSQMSNRTLPGQRFAAPEITAYKINTAKSALMPTTKQGRIRTQFSSYLHPGELLISPNKEYILLFELSGDITLRARGNGDFAQIESTIPGSASSAGALALLSTGQLVTYPQMTRLPTITSTEPVAPTIWRSNPGVPIGSIFNQCNGTMAFLSDTGDLGIVCGRYQDSDLKLYLLWSIKKGVLSHFFNQTLDSWIYFEFQRAYYSYMTELN